MFSLPSDSGVGGEQEWKDCSHFHRTRQAQEVGVGDALPSRRDDARFVVRLHFPFTIIISLAESD